MGPFLFWEGRLTLLLSTHQTSNSIYGHMILSQLLKKSIRRIE